MNPLRTLRGVAAPVFFGVALLAGAAGAADAACQLQSPAGTSIKHVIYLQFDNVHLRRDNPNVPSDLEQMPNLLNFLTSQGTVSGNHFTPLISHTADDIITAMTGVYPDRHGIPVANSYGFFRPDGSIGFQSSFLYWTATAADGKPQMINELGKTAPAPWVPFTRAGCDVGAFSIANIEFESIPADVNTVFPAGSPEVIEANDATQRDKAQADFLGIAIHCAQNSPLCNNTHARPDALPDEPGGYNGFNALYGNFHVQPVISPSGPVKDLDGNVIQTLAGNPGFPNLFNPLATQSLGYAATMLEAGVPVVYVYISDAHDAHSGPTRAYGPGEAPYVAQLASYDQAFGKFFQRLAAKGINKDNTVFVVTADENDHFAGGPPSPANCDGITTPCTYAKLGEINATINRLLITQTGNVTQFSVHSDDAPTVYINTNPSPTNPITRQLQLDMAKLQVTSLISGNTDILAQRFADQAEMKFLHMVTASPARTPSFTMFGNSDYFFITGAATNCSQSPPCLTESNAFVWNHGDFQQDIVQTWYGMVGPGIPVTGRNDEVFSDHTDLRPTMLALVGLKDDYVHDGRVLAERIHPNAMPASLRANNPGYVALATAYKALNAPLSPAGLASLLYATQSIKSSGDSAYQSYLNTLSGITGERDALAAQIKTALDNAAFNNQQIKTGQANAWISQANDIVNRIKSLAGQ